MKARTVVAGVLVAFSACFSLACSSSDDQPLIKWSCECSDVCAATEEVAEKTSYCSGSSSSNNCYPTGDTCVCPGGADKCTIVFP